MPPGMQNGLLNLLAGVQSLVAPPAGADPANAPPRSTTPVGQLIDRIGDLASLNVPPRPLIAAAIVTGIQQGIRESEERAKREEVVRQERTKEEDKNKVRLAEERKRADEEKTKREYAERQLVRAEAERDLTQQQSNLLRRRVQQVVPGLVLPPPFPAAVQV